MTTNVMDKKNNRVTSDTRWSLESVEGYVVYLDDTGFSKIAYDDHSVMICAGNARLIAAWKNWYASDVTVPQPPTKLVFPDGTEHVILMSLILKDGFRTRFSSGYSEEYRDDAKFSGTGSEAAKDCYSINGCSTKCVESAKNQDPFTGGEVQYVNFSTNETNVGPDTVTLEQMIDQLQPRGFAMDKKTKIVVPISQLPVNAFAKTVGNALEQLSAPTGLPPRDWTDRERHDAEVAMQEIRDLRKAARN